MKTWWIIPVVAILGFTASAAEPTSKQGQAAVIDFEADVIEGERLRPDIFVQMGSQTQEMDPVLYMRKDFNEFHRSDRKWRPGYLEPGYLGKPRAPKRRKAR